ncbi:FAD:protein FMN transferase [Marinilactibacillus piezotolerans]|uniref:FAD:protein FMN transferase n=1 Tax=Marinilactibacillus piezotolerans TaxID=258723 RepID=UPI0009B11BB7|nr:FAD:protein FMN transferase [Marinilactibacillus piezotolerans]
MRKAFIYIYLFPLIIFSILLSGCQSEQAQEDRNLAGTPYERTEFLMGTVVRVTVYNDGKEEALTKAFDRIESLASYITTEETEEHSIIQSINDAAGQEAVSVPDDLYALIRSAVHYSEKTEGSFDLSVGPLTSLWHIGYPDARKPAQSEIDEVLSLIDYKIIELDDTEQTVYLPEKGMQIDLGGIAKGFITDEAVNVLKDNGVDTAIVDLGGNIFVMGNSARSMSEKWNVGVQDPFKERGEILGSIPVSNRSIVTSGIYERYLEADGKQYHHLLDPKTGYPFDNELAGVSVITDQSIDGDGLSTSLFSKGLEDGLSFVNQLENTEAIFVTKDKEVYLSKGLTDFDLTNDAFTLMDEE